MLDIACSDDLIVLCESKGKEAPYATLSYCWGGGLSLEDLVGDSPDVFPATMKDAIPLARNLGLRYIWTD